MVVFSVSKWFIDIVSMNVIKVTLVIHKVMFSKSVETKFNFVSRELDMDQFSVQNKKQSLKTGI